jgi:hypothetical protein
VKNKHPKKNSVAALFWTPVLPKPAVEQITDIEKKFLKQHNKYTF